MRRERLLASAVASLLVLALGVGPAGGSVAEKKKRTKPENPCKVLTKAEIEAEFGAPTTSGKGGESDNPNSKDDCPWIVAPNALSPQGGTLYVITFFPSRDLGSAGSDAVDAVERQRDLERDGTAQTVIEVPDVGAVAYLNDFTVTLVFAKNTKRAYSIQWADNDISSFGLPTPQPIVDRLKALALEIVGG